MDRIESQPYDWQSPSEQIHWTRKRNDTQDVHLISNIVVKHDSKGRFITDYKRRYPNMWDQHVNINSESSPKKPAGVLSGLKIQ